MPTLDDAPTIEVLLGTNSLLGGNTSSATLIARGDLIQVFDISEQKPKTITVQELGKAFGLTFT
jgi:hypothetical protein